MTDVPFYHKKSKLMVGMRCAAGILSSESVIICDSVADASGKMIYKMYSPERLARTRYRQHELMTASIEVGISKGFFQYSMRTGEVTLTREGRRELNLYRELRKQGAPRTTAAKISKRKKPRKRVVNFNPAAA